MTPPRESELELRSRVPASAHGTALIDYLLHRFRYHDRAQWLREIEAGRLTLDGLPLIAEAPLRGGAQLTYRRQHREPPIDDRVGIVHDDAHVLVVDKPAHLPMHADGPFVRHTLIHLLQTRLAAPGLHLVHRLDRETSGLCVLARSALARDHLRRQFERGSVRKVYLAVVHGRVKADFVVERAIGRSATSQIALRRATADDALEPRAARTDFTVVRHGSRHTLLQCTPHTGRTHQIRVHLEAAGSPVVGDKLYGRPDADYLAFVARVKAGGHPDATDDGGPGRQLLHATSLGFEHPHTGAAVRYDAPMPEEFARWIDE